MLSVLKHIFRGFSLTALLVTLVPISVAICLLGGFIFLPLPATIPEPKAVLPSQATKIYDVDGKQIADLGRFEINVPIQKTDIPQVLKNAVISSEDRNFYKHSGVDVRGSARALWADLRNKETVQGGSTITQQYVKLAYKDQDRTISRKIREAIRASQLDRQIDKDEIIYRYLSIVYLGDGAYGVGAASETYFRKPVNELNVSEAAALAGIIPAPSARAPRDNIASAETFRKLVLQQMFDERYIDKATFDDAMAKPLWLDSNGEPPGPVTKIYERETVQTQFPYFVDYVRRYLEARYGIDKVRSGGLQVQTTLSPELQELAEKTVSDKLRGTSAPLDMAMVAVEPPTGYVKAIVGGRDFAKAQVNLALGGCPTRPVGANGKPMQVQVEPSCWSKDTYPVSGGGVGRQPGSSYKAFVLAAAYEQGIGPNTSYSAPSSWSPPGCRGASCVIRNYEGEAGGRATLKESTWHSYNTVYAPLIRDIGIKQDGKAIDGFIHTAELAKRLGVTSSYYAADFHQTGGNYALGVIDVAPLDMASAYGVFANRGMRLAPTPVVKVIDDEGNVLEDNSAREPQRVLDEAVADNVTDTLRGVIESGTGRSNGQIGRPAAGKTGTGEEYTNAWFVGYTPTLSTAVWMGYSDRPRTINYKGNTRVAGGTEPTKTWATFMKAALKDVPTTDFSEPAPIKAPDRNVLNLRGENSGPLPIAPQQQRKPTGTPTGDFDQVQRGTQAATPPTTPVP